MSRTLECQLDMIPAIGINGAKGDPFLYSDFTPAQLEALKVKGDQGIQGIQGTSGINGINGTNGKDGIDGKNGTNGVDGRSAYDLALIGGYTGTLAQFTAEAASLAGNSSRLTAAETNISNISSGKADKVTPVTTGNLAKLGVDGNIADSGITMEQLKKALFIDMWNEAAGVNGSYNQSEDKFYLYGESTDYVNALLAYRASSLITPRENLFICSRCGYDGELLFNSLVFFGINGKLPSNFTGTFAKSKKLKVVDITNKFNTGATIINSLEQAFLDCMALKKIIGILDISLITNDFITAHSFFRCHSLVDVKLLNLKVNMPFKYSSALSQQSILYMIQHSAATSAITITLHPTAYAMATADSAIQTALREKPLVSLAAEQ